MNQILRAAGCCLLTFLSHRLSDTQSSSIQCLAKLLEAFESVVFFVGLIEEVLEDFEELSI